MLLPCFIVAWATLAGVREPLASAPTTGQVQQREYRTRRSQSERGTGPIALNGVSNSTPPSPTRASIELIRSEASVVDREHALMSHSMLPMVFEPNVGQVRGDKNGQVN